MSLDKLHRKLQRMWREEQTQQGRKMIEAMGRMVKREMDKDKSYEDKVRDALT